MTGQHPAETAAIVRAWAVCDGDVQAQCAGDATQAADAESWDAINARRIALWQDELHGRDYLATVAERETEREERTLSAADSDAADVLRAATTEARRATRDVLRKDADDLFGAALDELKRGDAQRQRERMEGEQ